MYTMFLGCNSTMEARGKGSRHCGAELHTAACNRPAHPTLACVCLGGVIHIDAKPLLEDLTKLFVLLFSVGVLLFCQPSVRHQSMSNAFSLICCACTLSACYPYLLCVHVTFLLCTCCILPMACTLLTPACPYFHHTVTFYPPRVRIKACVHVCM